MQHKAVRGEYIGGAAPFGYRVAQDGRLEALEAEQAAIREARVLPGPTVLSLRAVAARLEGLGHRTRTGRAFAPVQVAA